MVFFISLFLLLIQLSTPGFATEDLTLTTLEVKPDISSYRVSQLNLDWDAPQITIVLLASSGERRSFVYTDDAALTLMRQLNKANLSTVSLHKRILEKLVTDGLLAGLVTGAAD